MTQATKADVQAQVDQAGSYTKAHPGRSALVTFSIANSPVTIDLTPDTCDPDPGCHSVSTKPKAGLCFDGSGIVVDALGPLAETDAVTLSAAGDAPVLRIYGSDNIFRGLTLVGSVTATTVQADTVEFMSTAARNRLEQSVVQGPSHGDAVGACGAASGADTDNLVVESQLFGAADKGLKADGAYVTIEGSCVANNQNGGIQATLGGHVTARENVVQFNIPGSAANGIFAFGDNPVDEQTTVETDGNIVRFAGERGLSVTGNAKGTFANDYVASNQYAGVKVFATLAGAMPPSATFTGVAFVCNAVPNLSGSCSDPPGRLCAADADCNSGACVSSPFPDGVGTFEGFDGACGACKTSLASCPCAPPTIDLGSAGAPGQNAATLNGLTADGINVDVHVPSAVVSAFGNEWESCVVGPCAPEDIRAVEVRHASDAKVDLEQSVPGARQHRPILFRTSPGRPRKGDLVRVFGEGLNAIDGNAVGDGCHTARPSPDHCDTTNPAVAAANHDPNGNRTTIAFGETIVDVDVDAVTPTMLAFRMPFDCFAPMTLTVTTQDASSQPPPTISLCDPSGGQDARGDIPCDDGDPCTIGDQCDGAGHCVPGNTVGPDCSTATSSSSTLPSTTTSNTTTTTTTTIQPTTTSTSTSSTIGSITTTATPSTTTTMSPTTATSSTTRPTTTSIPSTTTSTSRPTTTTTSTLPCRPEAPSTCNLDLCQRPKLHMKAVRLAHKIDTQSTPDAGPSGSRSASSDMSSSDAGL